MTSLLVERIAEKDFQQSVIDLARLQGWLVYHAYSSRRSPSGFPDLLCVHPRTGRVLAIELKTERGRVTAEQQKWIDALARGPVEAFVARPSDWPRIEAALAGGRA